jgi:MYXO-CTERM domain-containing protein
MIDISIRKAVLFTAATCAIALPATQQTARAVPVNGQFIEDPRCDVVPSQFLTHELGQFGFFPINESFEWQFQPSNFTVCVPNDGLANDWNVQIRNTSGIPWMNLFFVVDVGSVYGNADGRLHDVNLAPGVFTDAMRIDGTVTAGVNNNLLFESGPVDEIFSPGEIWRFNVSNFNNNAALNNPPIFRSPGVFAGSSPVGTAGGNASILAVPVPEPTTVSVALLGAGAALRHRRRRP